MIKFIYACVDAFFVYKWWTNVFICVKIMLI